MSKRARTIEQKLRAALNPISLEIRDDSDLHAGHAGAREGGGHFAVSIVASEFEGLNTLARHRLVYDALADMMRSEIHALSIDARAPGEG